MTTQDGTSMRFRMTKVPGVRRAMRRILESSRDGGQSWTTVLDYTYRRQGPDDGAVALVLATMSCPATWLTAWGRQAG